MKENILLVNICKEKLHYYEFVKPIEDILKNNKIKYFVKHYKNLKKGDLKKANKIIICGTSLKDNDFIKEIKKFSWIKTTTKPVLGICAGMQIISVLFESRLKKETEIGFYHEEFEGEFLGLKESQEVYHLHNNFTTIPERFRSFTNSKIPQAIKHQEREVYAVLFHPEVRQKDLIKKFCLGD